MPSMTSSSSRTRSSAWRSFFRSSSALSPFIGVRAYALESAAANESGTRLVFRRGLGSGLRRHQDRLAACGAVHLPHAALRPRPALPVAGHLHLAHSVAEEFFRIQTFGG